MYAGCGSNGFLQVLSGIGRKTRGHGEQTGDLGPGEAWCIGGGVEHGAEVLADAVVIEVFAPVRDDYLPARR